MLELTSLLTVLGRAAGRLYVNYAGNSAPKVWGAIQNVYTALQKGTNGNLVGSRLFMVMIPIRK